MHSSSHRRSARVRHESRSLPFASLTTVFALAVFALAPCTGHALDVHVAPTGSDTAAGTAAAPLKTLQAAFTAMLRAGPGTSNNIVLAPGTYKPVAPLVVNTPTNVTIAVRAADPAKPPVIDGSSLPVPTERKVLKEAALFFTRGSIVLEDLRIINTPTDGVRAEQVNPFQMRRCTLEDIYGHGVRVAGGRDAVIDSCEVKGVGGTGIWVIQGSRGTLLPSNAVISNNRVSDVNRWKDGTYLGNGIYVEGVGMTVRQNTIRDSVQLPSTLGIRVEGNNHLVEKNRLTHVGYGDAAGIYINGRFLERRGNIVRFNYIEDCSSGVYLDDRASGNTVSGNVIVKAKLTGILIGGGQDNSVTNNIVTDSASFLLLDNRGMGWASHKHPFKDDFAKLQTALTNTETKSLYYKAYPTLAALKPANALLPLNNRVSGNYASRESAGMRLMDMDGLLGGKHQAAFQQWNRLTAPAPFTPPSNKVFDLGRLGAAGLNTDQLGAQAK